MNRRTGINISKQMDSLNKRVKVPAITQRDYYVSNNDEDELIDFLKITSTDPNHNIDTSKYNYLDDEYDCDCDCDEEEDYCDEDCCCCNMFDEIDKKTILYAGVGVLVGGIVIYKLLKNRR